MHLSVCVPCAVRIEYLPSGTNGNGVMLDNGSWNGIVGVLQREEADASIESLTMTSSRWQAIDLVSPLWTERCSIMRVVCPAWLPELFLNSVFLIIFCMMRS